MKYSWATSRVKWLKGKKKKKKNPTTTTTTKTTTTTIFQGPSLSSSSGY
jgi:hypothetical protein